MFGFAASLRVSPFAVDVGHHAVTYLQEFVSWLFGFWLMTMCAVGHARGIAEYLFFGEWDVGGVV